MNEKIINYVYDDHENEFDETVNSYDLEFINDNNAETENDLIDNNNEETAWII